MRSGRGRAAAHGLVAGFLAALAMVLLMALLRLFLGIPLLAELASDRIVPTLSIRQFGSLAAKLGGLKRGKEIALVSGFALQVGVATIAGAVGSMLLRSRRGFGRAAALILTLVLGVAAGLALLLLWPVLSSNDRGLPAGPSTAVNAIAIIVSFALYGLVFWLAFRAMAVPASGGEGAGPAASSPGTRVLGRRNLLVGGTALGLAIASGSLADVLYRRATVGPNGYDGLSVRGPHTDPITPNDRFYVVTKNLIDPVVDRGLWRLQVTGLVENPRTFRFEELAALSTRTQTQTLECISNGVGGGLMSNASWKGVPLGVLLSMARPHPNARFVFMHAADGYTHGISLERAMQPSSMVAHEMNGAPLPDRHGYPARVLIPGTYGEVNVKWVDRIELVDRPIQGYYERQGWRPDFVNTTSRFDQPTNGQRISLATQPRVPANGVAFAGDRGISRVEVSFDGGDTWTDARIDGAPGPFSWALWSTTWSPPSPGSYTLVVRATDGTGAVQTSARRGVAPSGATGFHQVRALVLP